MADTVKLRHPELGDEIEKSKAAVPFFVNQGYVVLDKDGRVSGSATAAAKKESN